MPEFGEFTPNYEMRFPLEIEHANSSATDAFVDAGTMDLDWDDDETSCRNFLSREIISSELDFLVGRTAQYYPETQQSLVTKYVLNLQTGKFIVPREYIDGEYSPFRFANQAEADVMYQMGQWHPAGGDWGDFLELIERAQEHAKTLKIEQEKRPKSSAEILAYVQQFIRTQS